MVYLYLEALLAVAAVLSLIFLVAPDTFDSLHKESSRWIVAGSFFAVAVVLLVLFVATYVYRQTRLLLTDKNIVYVQQTALLLRKVSRLSIATVEDASADQRGILATIFNYGTLVIQTAGKTENFIFPTCPDPNRYAGMIIAAREAYAESLKEPMHP